MNDKEQKRKKPEKPGKRPWRPPTFKSGRLFESNSLACGKLQTDEMCAQVGIQSS